MKVVALSFVVVLLCFHADAQTIDDIIQYIFDHSSDCGDPFSDPVWVPALDLCTIGCDTLGEICMEDADLNQRCDPLPDKCTGGLKKKYPNAIGKKTKPHSGERVTAAPEKEAPTEPPAEEETELPIDPEKSSKGSSTEPNAGGEEEYGKSNEAPGGGAPEGETAEGETAAKEEEGTEPSEGVIETAGEETEAPSSETLEGTTEAPSAPVEQPDSANYGPGGSEQPSAPQQPSAPAGYNGGAGGAGGAGGNQGARDYHTWCCKWAYEGYCNTRPVLIRPLCQKSCGTYGCRAENALSCPVTVNVSPDTCWQLKGKTGNPDRHATHFQPQPGAVAQPYTITEVGAPVPKPQPPSQPLWKTQPQGGQSSYQPPAAPPSSQPGVGQPSASYGSAAPPPPQPQQPPPPQPSAESYPSAPQPAPAAQSYPESVPQAAPKPASSGGYRQRLLLHRRFLLLRHLYRH